MKRGTAALLALALPALWLRDADASTSVAVPFDTLVQASSGAAVVTPVTQSSQWEEGRIVTYTDAHIDQRIAGSGLPDEVWVRTLGGEVGHIGQSVEGEAVFTVGRPSLIFVRPAAVLGADTATGGPAVIAGLYSVTARAQGQFPIVADERRELRVRRSSGVGATVAPIASTPPVLATDVLHGLTVTDAVEKVHQAWSRLHGQ